MNEQKIGLCVADEPVMIKPEDRQLLANFVKNLTNEQRREMLHKLLKTSFKRILTDEEMEKFREQLRADLSSKHGEIALPNVAQ